HGDGLSQPGRLAGLSGKSAGDVKSENAFLIFCNYLVSRPLSKDWMREWQPYFGLADACSEIRK
ncbi:MAG: hypothetical protein AAFN92_20105, partial [Bacteroidota bacterium]